MYVCTYVLHSLCYLCTNLSHIIIIIPQNELLINSEFLNYINLTSYIKCAFLCFSLVKVKYLLEPEIRTNAIKWVVLSYENELCVLKGWIVFEIFD